MDDNEDSHTTSRLGVARIISALTASTSLCCSDFHFLSSLALLPTDVVCTFTRTGMLASRAHRPMFVSKHEALRPVLSTQVDRARNARTWSVAHCSFHSRQTMSPKRLSADGAIAFIVTSTIAMQGIPLTHHKGHRSNSAGQEARQAQQLYSLYSIYDDSQFATLTS